MNISRRFFAAARIVIDARAAAFAGREMFLTGGRREAARSTGLPRAA